MGPLRAPAALSLEGESDQGKSGLCAARRGAKPARQKICCSLSCTQAARCPRPARSRDEALAPSAWLSPCAPASSMRLASSGLSRGFQLQARLAGITVDQESPEDPLLRRRLRYSTVRPRVSSHAIGWDSRGAALARKAQPVEAWLPLALAAMVEGMVPSLLGGLAASPLGAATMPPPIAPGAAVGSLPTSTPPAKVPAPGLSVPVPVPVGTLSVLDSGTQTGSTAPPWFPCIRK